MQPWVMRIPLYMTLYVRSTDCSELGMLTSMHGVHPMLLSEEHEGIRPLQCASLTSAHSSCTITAHMHLAVPSAFTILPTPQAFLPVVVVVKARTMRFLCARLLCKRSTKHELHRSMSCLHASKHPCRSAMGTAACWHLSGALQGCKQFHKLGCHSGICRCGCANPLFQVGPSLLQSIAMRRNLSC